jgi:predicted nucleic acid-binding protein
MTPNLYPFDAKYLPESGEIMIADTSFVIELWGRSERPKLKKECQNFIDDMAAKGIYFATTIKTHEELRINTTYSILGGSKKRKAKLKSGQCTMESVVNTTNQIEDSLKGVSNYYPEIVGNINSELLEDVDNYMKDYNIEFGDAVIYAICRNEGVENIITLDKDYLKIQDDALNIYTNYQNYQQLLSSKRNGTSL